MKKLFLLSANIVIFVLLLSACSGGSKTSSHIDDTEGDTLCFRYAENISIVKFDKYYKVTLRNPWDTIKTLRTYILVERHDNEGKDNNIVPGQKFKDATTVNIPIEKAVIYSSVHCSLIDELGAIESIAGICDMKYVNVKNITELYNQGKIADCGEGMNPDIEKIIDIQADAIMLSPFENSGGYGRVENLNIPIIECADYMETSSLGRAEWIKFYGLLAGKAKEADSLFSKVEKEYLQLKELAMNVDKRPTVITEMKYGSAWYVPAGNSTMCKTLTDAGAKYIFDYTEGSGSKPLSFETVFDKGQKADFWLIKYNQTTDKTYSELASDYSPYKNFDAWKNRKIYGCNTRYVNFYEESPFHPEKLLKDLILIFHPELKGHVLPENSETNYFTPLK